MHRVKQGRIGCQPLTRQPIDASACVTSVFVCFRPLELSKLLSGCATLRLQLPGQLQQGLLQSFLGQLPAASSSDITLVLRALATWSMQQQREQEQQQQQQPRAPGQQLRLAKPCCVPQLCLAAGGCQAVQMQASSTADMKLPGLSSAVFCSAGQPCLSLLVPTHHLPSGCLSIEDECSSLEQQGGLLAGKDWLLPLSAAGRLLAAAGAVLHRMRAVEVCQCLWAAAWLRPAAGLAWAQAINSALPGRVHELALGDVCLLLWSLVRLQQPRLVKPPLLQQLLLRSQECMLSGPCTPRDLSSLVWGYWSAFGAGGRQLPEAWLCAFRGALVQQLRLFSTRQLGVTLHACVRLHISLGQELLDAVTLLVEVRSAGLSAAEMRQLVQATEALQQLERRRGASWPAFFDPLPLPHSSDVPFSLVQAPSAGVAESAHRECSTLSVVVGVPPGARGRVAVRLPSAAVL